VAAEAVTAVRVLAPKSKSVHGLIAEPHHGLAEQMRRRSA
jgi:hypothetical protein